MTDPWEYTLSALPLASSAEPELDGLAGTLVDLMEDLGGPGAGIAVFAENLFPPLPSELFLPLAGFTASQGRMSLAEALIWTTLGSVVGALALYGFGALLGRDRLRRIIAKIPLMKVSDYDRTEEWFAKHGTKAVLFGRVLPIFRSLISIPAGVVRMPILTFVALTALGSAVWNTVLVIAGYSLGNNWHRVEGYAGIMERVVLGGVALGLVVFVWTRVSGLRKEKRARQVK
ncbi:DedA family protein [Streptomyces uncialis]|uniref:DedA family protein n=1 Tax=Streptomyces uncialis TaxID=1048205 RepID=UPI0022579BBD|nr:DedA family protein [Streptomyces uncialis]MCX4662239.1 DedA family protein [Streptomyces uncialis]